MTSIPARTTDQARGSLLLLSSPDLSVGDPGHARDRGENAVIALFFLAAAAWSPDSGRAVRVKEFSP